MMKQLTDGLYILEGFPPYAINVYLLGEVLVDAATRYAAPRLLRRLRGRKLTVHALTHAHPDHQGSSHAICAALGLPLASAAAAKKCPRPFQPVRFPSPTRRR
jgi:glyoxylase-like metal-dependent hydrolase (beta-lactamase superfamily II)